MSDGINDGTHELTLEELEAILSKTIIEDEETKLILFLVCLLTFTDEEQRNVILTGESSVGKTYNLTEILWFFPKDSIVEVNDASPRSFVHQSNYKLVDARTVQPIDMTKKPKEGDSQSVFEEWYDLMRNSAYFLDYSNKILVFLDMPNFKLLEHLRSLLSHDRKISKYLIADKNKGANRTKTVLIQGYFTGLFASAYENLEDQEASRNFILSPTDNPDKIKKAVDLQAFKKVDPTFKEWYENDKNRKDLKERVETIKNAGIKNVYFGIDGMESLKQWFFEKTKNLSPKVQRDFPRLYALAEAWALLNWKHRERINDDIYADSTDIEIAKRIYEPILTCNELGLSPEEFEVWRIIEPQTNLGLKISEIHNLYYAKKKRNCSDKRLRGMLKNFCRAGLLREEKEGQTFKYYTTKSEEPKPEEATQTTLGDS
jgi:hypothetical protein